MSERVSKIGSCEETVLVADSNGRPTDYASAGFDGKGIALAKKGRLHLCEPSALVRKLS